LLTLWLSYTIYDEVVNPLTCRKYTVLNRNSVFNLHDVFQESNSGVKQELPVHCTEIYILYKQCIYTVQVHMPTNDIVIQCIG